LAYISIDGVSTYNGSFITEDDAFRAYKKEKEKEVKRWSKRLKCGDFLIDQRVINALKN
jgi:hypothetical protein